MEECGEWVLDAASFELAIADGGEDDGEAVHVGEDEDDGGADGGALTICGGDAGKRCW